MLPDAFVDPPEAVAPGRMPERANVEEVMFCNTCGNLIKDGENVCSVCGSPVQTAPVIPVSAASDPIPSNVASPDVVAVGPNSGISQSPPPPAQGRPLFDASLDSPASVKKFDFSWESEAFHHQDQKTKSEDIEFRWNTGSDGLDASPAASVAAAVDKRESAASARKREEVAESIFQDDTSHLYANENEKDAAEVAVSKKNEEFQELLDEEFGKIKVAQPEIDEDRNRIGRETMTSPEPIPTVLVTGENARNAADERIQEYLRKADMEMRRALEEQAAAASGVESAPVSGFEPVIVPEVKSASAPVIAPEPASAPVIAPEPASAPEVQPAPAVIPAPAPGPESSLAAAPGAGTKTSESFDPYESFGGSSFSAPDEQETNMRAFGFRHGEGDIEWEYEHKDYDPSVSAIAADDDAERTPDYLAGRSSSATVADAVHPAEAGLAYDGIFLTSFANPFAADVRPGESAVSQPARGEYASPAEARHDGVFDTEFANPFAEDAITGWGRPAPRSEAEPETGRTAAPARIPTQTPSPPAPVPAPPTTADRKSVV
jgi:hypothetical protein